jgi:hypothetical protein
MRTPALIAIASCIALSGCVFGSGACLFEQPFKHTLVGTIHFRSYPAGDGIDRVPVFEFGQNRLHLRAGQQPPLLAGQ